jgi:hypothetical protein
MPHDQSLETMWADAPAATGRFEPEMVDHLPEPARRYLRHTLAPGAPLSTTLRLSMTGEIKLGGHWRTFAADQVARWDRGFVWAARTRIAGLPIRGADSLIDGHGEMRWRMLGIIPVMSADGADVSRAAAGRMHSEALWLPAALLGDDVTWSADHGQPHLSVRAHGEDSELSLTIDADGAVQSMSLLRWRDHGAAGSFSYSPFGGTTSADATFGGVTLPTRYAIGWDFGSDTFATEGEFFRCTIHDVAYR